MKYVKNCHKSSLTNNNLNSIMRKATTNVEIDFDKITNEKLKIDTNPQTLS